MDEITEDNIPYDHYIDTDDSNYFIRKYSDENMPIYNKKLSVSPINIIDDMNNQLIHHHTKSNALVPYCNYKKIMCYICIVITIELLIIIIRIFYSN